MRLIWRILTKSNYLIEVNSLKNAINMEKWELKRTIQCAKCPWKCSTNPFDIPGGYDVEKHKNLKSTIAEKGSVGFGSMKVMACHHSKNGNEEYCIGWLNHQLGEGNNIGLRIKMMSCTNAKDIKVVGEQHERFEDTLPTCSL